MADIPDAIRNEIVDWIIGKANPTPTSGTRYLALFNGDPQGAGSEVTTTIRPAGRVDLTTAMELAGATTQGQAANTSEVDFGNADAGATVSHIAIYSASSGGTLLASDALSGGTQTITAGNPVKVPVGDLTVSIT